MGHSQQRVGVRKRCREHREGDLAWTPTRNRGVESRERKS
jgi:hypothetical protein